MWQPGECPIWGTNAQRMSGYDGMAVQGSRTDGEYRITGSALAVIDHWSDRDRALLTTWIVDQHRAGDLRPLVDTDVVERAKALRPLTYSEKKQRLFLMFARRAVNAATVIRYDQSDENLGPVISAWIESERAAETSAFMQLMEEEGLLAARGHEMSGVRAAGFQYLELIEAGGAPTDQAFVAMWFDQSMEAAFTQGIELAVAEAGYRAFRVDRKETVNKIDDEIIAEIRRSRFVIADFTCAIRDVIPHDGEDEVNVAEHRGGVYFEAGFAFGLSTPVIWMVHKDCLGYVHFDIRQFSHIVWENPDDLRTKLRNRIGAIIGDGPLKPI